MTTPSPDPMGAYIESGVIGFVFAEMWRRGVLSPRDRRWITLTCVGAIGAAVPIETHVYAALATDDISYEEYDEFVLFLGTQLGWPKASVMFGQGMMSWFKIAEERGIAVTPPEFELWAEPTADDVRRDRGEAAYQSLHGHPPAPAITAFQGRSYLDYLYGEVWTREKFLTRRDKRIVAICASAAAGVEEAAADHVHAALEMGEFTFEEMQELVVHFAVYLGWNLGRRLDDTLIAAARELGLAEGDAR